MRAHIVFIHSRCIVDMNFIQLFILPLKNLLQLFEKFYQVKS